MICAASDDGRIALVVQIETRTSQLTLLYEFDENSEIIDDPHESDPILPEGLCFFPERPMPQ